MLLFHSEKFHKLTLLQGSSLLTTDGIIMFQFNDTHYDQKAERWKKYIHIM